MRPRFTRRALERAHARACLTAVLVLVLPLLVLLVSGALANGRRWRESARPRVSEVSEFTVSKDI
jgi:hypothetical protein